MSSALYLKIETMDALAVGLVILIFGGILAAFFYLRTAYKKVAGRASEGIPWIAVIALLAFAVLRIVQNHEIQQPKRTIDSWFRH